MSKRSRDKGAAGEREARDLLRTLWPEADRNPMQARGAKRDGCDVEGTPWWVEVKRGARPNPLAALAQAYFDAGHAGDYRAPLVLARKDRREWTVTLLWDDFAELVRQGQRARETAVQMASEPDCEDCGQPTMHAGPVCYGCSQEGE